MDPHYSYLPTDVVQLAEEIEQHIGKWIRFVHDPTLSHEAACRIGEAGAGTWSFAIFHRDERPEPGDMLHELLHTRRYFVEGAPMMRFTGLNAQPRTDGLTHEDSFENMLEHLVVNPEVYCRGYWDFRAHERNQVAGMRSWEPIIQAPGFDRERARMGFIVGWLTSAFVYRAAYAVACEVARMAGLLDDALMLERQVRAALPRKEPTVLSWCEAARVPVANIRLHYYSFRAGEPWTRRIAGLARAGKVKPR